MWLTGFGLGAVGLAVVVSGPEFVVPSLTVSVTVLAPDVA